MAIQKFDGVMSDARRAAYIKFLKDNIPGGTTLAQAVRANKTARENSAALLDTVRKGTRVQ